jgi:GGDEF domain-containing protein
LDGVYRLGGDEFVIVLPDTSLDDARVVMTRVERLGAPSFSWGLASVISVGAPEAAALQSVADEDLYERRRKVRTRRKRAGAATAESPSPYTPDLPEVPAGARRPITEIGRTSTA